MTLTNARHLSLCLTAPNKYYYHLIIYGIKIVEEDMEHNKAFVTMNQVKASFFCFIA